jgi:hypothetical protein
VDRQDCLSYTFTPNVSASQFVEATNIMNTRPVAVLSLFCMSFACPSPSLRAAEPPPRRVVSAIRAAKAPVIDGDLSDAAWQNAPEITGFTQHDPDDGKPATQETIVKVVYDDEAVYISAFMRDANKVTTLLGRRDNSLESDWFRINIDSQHDRLSGNAFWINPSNVQLDTLLYNDTYDDTSWDAVWQSAAKIVPGGWVAEARIPYSQLRFKDAAQQVWGVNFARYTTRNKETDRLVNTPKGESGFVSRFAELAGLVDIHPARAFELVPYGVAQSNVRSRFDRRDPFARQQASRMDGGLDVKYGLTPSLTLTGTINPDFGQVEVDPAVVNLSTFETFFPEKRPFFTEGLQMFRFGSGPANTRASFNFYPPNFFYSRRIGRSPQGTDNLDADFVRAPVQTTILGAAKLTGKVGNGWSVGVLDALTDRERASFVNGTGFRSEVVEPMTNYLVARGAKEYGNSRIGVMFTSVDRRIPSELSYLRADSHALGVDGYTLFGKDKGWLFEWLVGSSLVKGSKEAIDATQRSSARYYQRPDADYVHYDPTRTSLTGGGGRAMINKQNGRWRTNWQLQTWTPGFEINDVGFMPRADMISTHGILEYVNEEPRKYVRETDCLSGKYQNWNYGKDLIANGLYANCWILAQNYWSFQPTVSLDASTWDDRRTRGGPLARRPAGKYADLTVGSDTRKKFQVDLFGQHSNAEDGGFTRGGSVTLRYRPTSNVLFSIAPSYTRSRTASQYVTKIADPTYTPTFGTRYVFANIEQRTVDIGTRVEWTASSRLSFQLYLQPFIATGDYHGFKYLGRARSGDYTPINNVAFSPATNEYTSAAGTFGNPNFNVRSVRGNAVVRWEFRPGSALYVVWNENRAGDLPTGDFHFRRDLQGIVNAESTDVFLVKVSYWLPM